MRNVSLRGMQQNNATSLLYYNLVTIKILAVQPRFNPVSKADSFCIVCDRGASKGFYNILKIMRVGFWHIVALVGCTNLEFSYIVHPVCLCRVF